MRRGQAVRGERKGEEGAVRGGARGNTVRRVKAEEGKDLQLRRRGVKGRNAVREEVRKGKEGEEEVRRREAEER